MVAVEETAFTDLTLKKDVINSDLKDVQSPILLRGDGNKIGKILINATWKGTVKFHVTDVTFELALDYLGVARQALFDAENESEAEIEAQ